MNWKSAFRTSGRVEREPAGWPPAPILRRPRPNPPALVVDLDGPVLPASLDPEVADFEAKMRRRGRVASVAWGVAGIVVLFVVVAVVAALLVGPGEPRPTPRSAPRSASPS